ncbi:MAG TPA: 1,4-dihydroxy-6-naphthoate synthase [Syntrophorhabdaceae bacterium]|nr:1,4-dihydroxy-6-naphthoate synthase [Syntrophorhabdaceae bacterium]
MTNDTEIYLDLAFSPCPNDTFIFHALVARRIDTMPFYFNPFIEDVEELNRRAFGGIHHITKLSFYAYLLLKDRYELLDAGAAMGFGCGPLLVAGESLKSLKNARIAVPGQYTTAYLLFQLWHGKTENVIFTRFDNILPGIASGEYDCGIIIHEGRFVYPDYNCVKVIDLGEWWETQTGLPIPLGCITIKSHMVEYKISVENLIRNSIDYARRHPSDSQGFIRSHAQEMDDKVISEHISLYVNEYSMFLDEQGKKAVSVLEEMARKQGLL